MATGRYNPPVKTTGTNHGLYLVKVYITVNMNLLPSRADLAHFWSDIIHSPIHIHHSRLASSPVSHISTDIWYYGGSKNWLPFPATQPSPGSCSITQFHKLNTVKFTKHNLHYCRWHTPQEERWGEKQVNRREKASQQSERRENHQRSRLKKLKNFTVGAELGAKILAGKQYQSLIGSFLPVD